MSQAREPEQDRPERAAGWKRTAALGGAAALGLAAASAALWRAGRPSATAAAPTVPTAAADAPREAGSLEPRFPEITIPRMFRASVERNGDRPAHLLKTKQGWQPLSYRELAERVRALGLGLRGLGVEQGEAVGLLSENRSEWAVSDLAILGIGGVVVPIYPTLPAPQVRFLLEDSGLQVLIVSTPQQLEKAREAAKDLPNLRHLVVIDPPDELPDGVLTLADLQQRGRETPDAEAAWHQANEAVGPKDLASIIYTSGTTGNPKGVMLTHANFTSNAQSVTQLIDITGQDVHLSFLPLSHVFARMADHYFPLLLGGAVAYSEGVFALAREMAEVKPTIMSLVPRVYESIQQRTLERAAALPPTRRKLFHWALGVGSRAAERRLAGRPLGPALLAARALADRLVLSKIRERVGTQLRYLISGGAPLPVETARFFFGVGFTLLEGYGLTETSPVITINTPRRPKLGTVGPPVPGVLVRIAEDGEILSRGPHIMQGYYHLPEETAQAIDADGWFHTGDIGTLDADGYLKITDRKKDLLVLANGKNVAPQPIEAKLRSSPYIQEAVLFGDRQPVIVALLIPAFSAVRDWAKEQGHALEADQEVAEHPAVRRLLKQELDKVGRELADFERVRRFALLPRAFTLEEGELTPTMKVRRRVVAERYGPIIQGLYRGGNGGS